VDPSQVDGKTIAVVYDCDGPDRVCQGTARYRCEELFGNVIRIKINRSSEENGRLDIIVLANEWNDLITSGIQYGCDYCLRVKGK
jgi:hypothetical protein